MSLHSLSQCLFHGCLILGDRLHNKYRHDAPSGFSVEELLIISKAQSIKLSHSSPQTIQTGPILYPPNTHTHIHAQRFLTQYPLLSPHGFRLKGREELMANRKIPREGKDWFNQARFFRIMHQKSHSSLRLRAESLQCKNRMINTIQKVIRTPIRKAQEMNCTNITISIKLNNCVTHTYQQLFRQIKRQSRRQNSRYRRA